MNELTNPKSLPLAEMSNTQVGALWRLWSLGVRIEYECSESGTWQACQYPQVVGDEPLWTGGTAYRLSPVAIAPNPTMRTGDVTTASGKLPEIDLNQKVIDEFIKQQRPSIKFKMQRFKE